MTDHTEHERPGKRHDYRRFPAAYFELVSMIEDRGPALASRPISLGPLARNTALTKRRHLYTFRMFLLNADPGDDYARALGDVLNSVTLSLEPAATKGPNGEDTLIVIRPEALGALLAAARDDTNAIAGSAAAPKKGTARRD